MKMVSTTIFSVYVYFIEFDVHFSSLVRVIRINSKNVEYNNLGH